MANKHNQQLGGTVPSATSSSPWIRLVQLWTIESTTSLIHWLTCHGCLNSPASLSVPFLCYCTFLLLHPLLSSVSASHQDHFFLLPFSSVSFCEPILVCGQKEGKVIQLPVQCSDWIPHKTVHLYSYLPRFTLWCFLCLKDLQLSQFWQHYLPSSSLKTFYTYSIPSLYSRLFYLVNWPSYHSYRQVSQHTAHSHYGQYPLQSLQITKQTLIHTLQNSHEHEFLIQYSEKTKISL